MSLLDPFTVPTAGSCAVCGCTDDRACAGGCTWAAPGICSRCAGMTRVNLTPAGSCFPADAGKEGLPHGQGTPCSAGGPARTEVDVPPALPTGGTSTRPKQKPAWHEVCYRDPRKGEMAARWVSITDARAKAKKIAARIPGTVEIWAVYRDATGRVTHSALIEVVAR